MKQNLNSINSFGLGDHLTGVCVCVYLCVRQCEPWSGVNLLDWDLELLRPTAFPSPEVGLLT